MPKDLGAQPNRRNKKVIVITRPYISPDPAGPKYEQYCQHSLMKHKSFREVTDLLAGHNIHPSLEEDIFRLQQHQQQKTANNEVR